jgi:nucleotide-binding universal stress UspA family protein
VFHGTILVPLDGSAPAEKASPSAERLARAAPTRLVLVRVSKPDALETHSQLSEGSPNPIRGG